MTPPADAPQTRTNDGGDSVGVMEATAKNRCQDGSLSPTRQRPTTSGADKVPAKRNDASLSPATPPKARASVVARPTAAKASAVETSSAAQTHSSKATESEGNTAGGKLVGEGRGNAGGQSGTTPAAVSGNSTGHYGQLAGELPKFVADVVLFVGSLRSLVACQAVSRSWHRAVGGDHGEVLFGNIARVSGVPAGLRPSVWRTLVARAVSFGRHESEWDGVF